MDIDRSTSEQLTVEEFERVMRSDRFATVHDLARSAALDELTFGARATPTPSGDGSGDTLPTLPTRH